MAAMPIEHRVRIDSNGELMESFDHRDIDVFVGIDMAKQDHYAHTTNRDGT
ncbi:MAG: hypothetical protein ACE37B_05380 [Ilumatobacter sp.]|uniref:hypothetical protein n=1 Tax=Ilumatobacter sp. TaxID=1967498 RepID=UPI00391D93FD